jgi:subtilisin family serine protease
VDDIHGYNFVSDTGDVTDDNGHGSHVAGARGHHRRDIS